MAPWFRRLVLVLFVLIVGAGLGWAGAVVFNPPQDVLASTPYTFVEVTPGEVGSSINLNTVAEWTPVPVGRNLAVGTVTTVDAEPGQEVGPGDVLYTVNLRPVVVAQGDIPAFETMAQGIEGRDVAQLQSMLATLGFYSGSQDGRFGHGTTTAVRAWQRSLGIPADGVVQAGDVIFVPALRTRVALDPELVARGASLTGGEAVVQGLPSQPTFTVPVSPGQLSLLPLGTRVEISGPAGETWEGLVADQTTDEYDQTTMVLAGRDGATICGQECGSVPVVGQSLLPSRVVTVEAVQGLTVPSAALRSHVDGSVTVVDQDGAEHPVTVLASARGMSVIEGVAAGTRVRVPVTGE